MLKFKTFMQEYWQLIKLHFANNKRTLLRVVAAFVLFCGAMYLGNGYRYANRDYVFVFMIVLSAGYALFVSMNDYYRHRRVYSAQLLPASSGAKFLSEITIPLIVIPLVLTIIHTAIDLTVFLCIDNEAYDCPLNQWGMGHIDWLVIPTMTYILIIANSVATLLKTRSNWIFAVMLGVSFLALLLMDEIGLMENYPGVNSTFFVFKMSGHNGWTSIEVQESWGSPEFSLWATRIWLWALPIACYIWSYFRFKEWSSR